MFLCAAPLFKTFFRIMISQMFGEFLGLLFNISLNFHTYDHFIPPLPWDIDFRLNISASCRMGRNPQTNTEPSSLPSEVQRFNVLLDIDDNRFIKDICITEGTLSSLLRQRSWKKASSRFIYSAQFTVSLFHFWSWDGRFLGPFPMFVSPNVFGIFPKCRDLHFFDISTL